MITSEQWQSLLHLTPSMFRYPDQLAWSVVWKLDKAITAIGSRAHILSDVRPWDRATGRHRHGDAIDTTWPGRDPIDIWNKLRGMNLFSGLGVYVNEAGIASFHTDTRPDRTPEDPALWGGIITHEPVNGGQREKKTEYVAAGLVLDVLKKKAPIAVVLILGALAWWLLTRNP